MLKQMSQQRNLRRSHRRLYRKILKSVQIVPTLPLNPQTLVDAFTCQFSGKLDSKGRITVPARIRDKLGLEAGDRISLSLDSSQVIRERFKSEREALDFLSSLDDIERFEFDGEVLEVVLCD